MKEYVENMKEYAKNMSKVWRNMETYVNIKDLALPYRLWDVEKFQALPHIDSGTPSSPPPYGKTWNMSFIFSLAQEISKSKGMYRG